MLSFYRRIQSRSSAFHDGTGWRLLSSKPAKSVISCLVAFCLLIAIWTSTERSYGDAPYLPAGTADSIETQQDVQVVEEVQEVQHSTRGRLHLLIPATSSNADLCKLLVSAQILGYPTPVLINWDDPEDKEDAYKQHIAKVAGFLNYLEQLETSSEYDEDLVLIVDGETIIQMATWYLYADIPTRVRSVVPAATGDTD
jgi:hypothetical protein